MSCCKCENSVQVVVEEPPVDSTKNTDKPAVDDNTRSITIDSDKSKTEVAQDPGKSSPREEEAKLNNEELKSSLYFSTLTSLDDSMQADLQESNTSLLNNDNNNTESVEKSSEENAVENLKKSERIVKFADSVEGGEEEICSLESFLEKDVTQATETFERGDGDNKEEGEEGVKKEGGNRKKQSLLARSLARFRKRRSMRKSSKEKKKGENYRASKLRRSIAKWRKTKEAEGGTTVSVDEHERQLAEMYPTTTQAERLRFLKNRTIERAIEKMTFYTGWRKEMKIDEPEYLDAIAEQDDDEKLWKFVVQYVEGFMQDEIYKKNATIPRFVRFGNEGEIVSLGGKRCAQVLPGMVDKKIASFKFYAQLVAVYLDAKLDRDSIENIFILVDVRAGKGWPNGSPTTLVPFIKAMTKVVSDSMPERMYKTLIYPLPGVSKPILSLILKLLPDNLTKKVEILWGAAYQSSPCPKQMRDHFNEETIKTLEAIRKSEFRKK